MIKIQKTVDEVISDGLTCAIIPNLNTRHLYPAYVRYFSNINEINKDNLIIGFGTSYSLMPTIGDIRNDNFVQCLKVLNKVKNGLLPTDSDWLELSSFTNNSVVGASKLLHFVNPSLIPIFDSRVYKYLTNKKNIPTIIKQIKFLQEYINFCYQITQGLNFNKVHQRFNKMVGYDLTPFRVCEFIMYIKGGK